MSVNNVKKIVADAKAAKRSGGPKTVDGKFRSSLNAVRHGLAGKHLLLPGEDETAYSRSMDGVFATFRPQTEAEAQLVALIGDDLHKLARLELIEAGVSLARIEQLLAQTGVAEKSAKLAKAVQAFGTALQAWESQPVSMEWSAGFSQRLNNLAGALAMVVESVDTPASMVSECQAAITKLSPGASLLGIEPADHAGLRAAAGRVMHWLLDEGARVEAEETQLRKSIAGISLPDEAELRKLARYRRILEDGLQRRLQALEQMRKLAAETPVAAHAGETAKAFRVQLRLVR